MYTVFTRRWWTVAKNRYGQTVKTPALNARRYILATVATEEEAAKICKEYNDTHNPGPASVKAEYTNQF